jgi:hypothetical protein
MNGGNGSDTWGPPIGSTGICKASAGYVNGDTYQKVTFDRELTPERLKAGTFPGAASESLKVYFCDQFFRSHPDSEAHASVFARYVDSAMTESWRTQVNTWGLDTPPDADHKHQVFINDNQNWYHNVIGAWAVSGANRQIGIRYNLWYGDSIDRAYSNESIRVKVAVAHEFYHGIQWGLDSAKWNVPGWRWFHEGQARFLPSAQYETEEFLDANHLFPDAANNYLTQHLNTSLRTLGNYPIMGYPYSLFWRFMYEHFRPDSIRDAVRFVSDCYAESVGIGNSISQGKLAIDRALTKYYAGHGTAVPLDFDNFLHALDQFAIVCYLNDTSFHKWNPNPPGVYSRPQLTIGTDTIIRLGPNEADSVVVNNNVPCSYGIDLVQVVLNGNVDTLRVELTRRNGGVLNARLVKVYPPTATVPYGVEPTVGTTGDSSASWCRFLFNTQGVERVCLVVTRQDALDDTLGGYTARFRVKRDVAVSDSLPISDTVIAGTEFTPRAVVANRGWMKEIFPATFKIGTLHTNTKTCTLDVGDSATIEFEPWTTTKGNFPTCCSVYIASDTTHSDDTLWGSLVALADTWQTRPPVPEGVGGGGSLAAVGDTCLCLDWRDDKAPLLV